MIDLAIPRMVENEREATTNGLHYRQPVGPSKTLIDDPTLEDPQTGGLPMTFQATSTAFPLTK